MNASPATRRAQRQISPPPLLRVGVVLYRQEPSYSTCLCDTLYVYSLPSIQQQDETLFVGNKRGSIVLHLKITYLKNLYFNIFYTYQSLQIIKICIYEIQFIKVFTNQ